MMTRKTKDLIANTRPPKVTIAGKEYQFQSLMELRFALLLESLCLAGTIEQWMYEPTTFQFPGYRTRPHTYKPDFVTIAGDETTVYEGVAYLTTEYLSKFRRLRALKTKFKVVVFMDKPDSSAKRKPLYEQAVEGKLVDHIWYAGADFRRLGILEAAEKLIAAAGGLPEEQAKPSAKGKEGKKQAKKKDAEPPVPVFAKIAAVGKVKSYKREEKGIAVAFKDLHFGDGHRALLDGWMDEHVKVRVTVEVYEAVCTVEKPEPSLFEAEPAPAVAAPPSEPGQEPSVPGQELSVPLPASYHATVTVTVTPTPEERWIAKVHVVLPGISLHSNDSPALYHRTAALRWADQVIGGWLRARTDYKHQLPLEQKVTNQISLWIADYEKGERDKAAVENAPVDDSNPAIPRADGRSAA